MGPLHRPVVLRFGKLICCSLLIASLLQARVSAPGASAAIDASGFGPSGVTLSLHLSAHTFTRGQILRVSVRLANASRVPIRVMDVCPYGRLQVQVLSASGAMVFPPSIPGAPPPRCPAPAFGSIVRPGTTLKQSENAIARGRVFVAIATLKLASGKFMAIKSTPITVQLSRGLPVQTDLVPGANGPSIEVKPVGSRKGPLLSAYWLRCGSPVRAQMESRLGYRLVRTRGGRVYPNWSSLGCPRLFHRELHAVVGWLGQRAAYVNYVGP
jgi:hypothetical protein